MRILFVDDDQKLCQLVRGFLEKEGYVCDTASTIEKAKLKISDPHGYDALILDVVLPDGDGVEFCRYLRASDVAAPILMLTAKSSTVDTVSGLDAGADDYMPKPFSPNELKARLRALLRRPKQTLKEELVCGTLRLNITSRTVTIDGEEITLMPKEYSLLEYLVRKKDEVVKKEDLLRHVWGIYSRTGSNRLEVYIRYLREKIDEPHNLNLIRTVRGAGYKIASD